MDKTLVTKFTSLVERAFSLNMEKLANHDFNKYQHLFKEEYDAAIKIVVSVKDAGVLAELMKTYLSLYERYSANKDNIHFYRSDQLFELLVVQSGKVSDETLFETWDALFASSSQTVSFKKRFAELNPTSQSNIEKFRRDEREKRRGRKSILDVLKNEYAKQFKHPPKSNDELYDFDPRPDSIKSPLDFQIAAATKYWNISKGSFTKENVDNFNAALVSFKDFVKSQGKKDLLSLFQSIKRLRELMNDKIEERWNPKTGKTERYRTSPDSHERVLFYGLYTIACIQLVAVAQADKLYVANRNGFTAEETKYFYYSVARDKFYYRSNIAKILSQPFRGPDTAFEEIKAFLGTYVLTKNQLKGLDLVDLATTLDIQQKWREASDLTDLIQHSARRKDVARLNEIFADPKYKEAIGYLKEIGSGEVKTKNLQELGKGTLRAGSKLGSHNQYGDITVVYISSKVPKQVFVELSTLKPQLFLASQKFIDDKFYAAQILEIYNSTIGVVSITEAIFLIMGFIPVLIEAGFAGLIYEIALTYASSELEEQAAKVHPAFGIVLGLLIQTFAPRPNFKPQLTSDVIEQSDRTGLSDVLDRGTKNRLSGPSVSDRGPREIIELTESPKADIRGVLTKDRNIIMRGEDPEALVVQSREVNRGTVVTGDRNIETKGKEDFEPTQVKSETKTKGTTELGKHEAEEVGREPVSAKTSANKGQQLKSDRQEIEDIESGKSNAKKARGTNNRGVDRPATKAQPVPQRRYQNLDTPDQIVTALGDPELFETYSQSFRYTTQEGMRAGVHISDLGQSISKYVRPGNGGMLDAKISEALWKLPEHLRGTLIEKALGSSQYREWFNVGALDHGWFPQVDFANRPPGQGQPTLASIKTVNPFAKSYLNNGIDTLTDHVEDIVTGSYNFAKGGKGFRNVIIDVRMPHGTAIPAADLKATLEWFVPADLKKYINIQVREF